MSIYAVRLELRNSFRSLSNKQIVIAFSILLAFRLLIAFVIVPVLMHRVGANYVSELFPDRYGLIADNLVNGLGYRVYPDTSLTMLRSPGFVLVLAAIFACFGKSLLAVQIVQFILSALTSFMVYGLTNKLFRVSQISLFAAALFLFHPAVMFAETRGGVDITLIFCFTLMIWLLFRALELESIRSFILFGLAFGYTLLVKASVALVFPAAFLVVLLGMPRRPGILIRNFILAGVTAVLVMSPWVLRNYEISGKFVPTMTVGGLAMFQGMYTIEHQNQGLDDFQLLENASQAQIKIGHAMGLPMRADFFPQFYSPQQEVTFYRALGERAWSEYLHSPTLLGRAIVHNLWSFWFEGRTKTATLINIVIMAPFLGMCIYGGMRAVRREPRCWILVAAILAFMLPHLLIIAIMRHSTTLLPIMAILAAASLLPRSSASALAAAESDRRSLSRTPVH